MRVFLRNVRQFASAVILLARGIESLRKSVSPHQDGKVTLVTALSALTIALVSLHAFILALIVVIGIALYVASPIQVSFKLGDESRKRRR